MPPCANIYHVWKLQEDSNGLFNICKLCKCRARKRPQSHIKFARSILIKRECRARMLGSTNPARVWRDALSYELSMIPAIRRRVFMILQRLRDDVPFRPFRGAGGYVRDNNEWLIAAKDDYRRALDRVRTLRHLIPT